jgi:long-chain acyl-CoA synthetase
MQQIKQQRSAAGGLPDTGGLLLGDVFLEREELLRRARQAASAFASMGIRQGDTVALLLRNDFTFFEATLGATMLGATTVPLNWHLTTAELRYVLDDCGAKVLVGHADLMATPAAGGAFDGLQVVGVEVPAILAEAYRISAHACELAEGILRWPQWIDGFTEHQGTSLPLTGAMFYTSGTTGRPKGVRRSLDVPAEYAQAAQRRTLAAYGLAGQGAVRAIMTGPLYHSAPNAYGMNVVRSGGLLILQPRFEPSALLADIERHRITHLHMVPTMFVRLLGLPESKRHQHDLSSLDFVVHGAAPCPVEIKRRMIEWWGPCINEYYAMTETGIICTSDSQGWLRHPGTVGTAALGVDIRILDDDGNPCAAGELGEVCVRSETSAYVAYHHAEDKTRDLRRGEHIATGDIGHVTEDGFLFISDRRSDMVLSGGVNIYPAEIEAALVDLVGVKDVAVFGIPDSEYGERVVAVIEAEKTISVELVVAFLRERIAGYKIPRDITFWNTLPREDSGKIKKRLIREAYLRDLQLSSQAGSAPGVPLQ